MRIRPKDAPAEFGNISINWHPDAERWAPPYRVMKKIHSLFPHKPIDIAIYPRYMIKEVYAADRCGKPYDKEYYAFRAYAGKDYCRIFVDETETPDSALWVMLHELAHIALASSPYLFVAYRHLTPSDYFESDDAHERDPEEQMANAMATAWMDMLGYGKVSYPRYWWRDRTIIAANTKVAASIRSLRDYTRRLRR